MTPAWRVGLAEGHVGDCRAVMAAMESESVNLCITSPPFFALRRYAGEQTVEWGDGHFAALGLERVPDCLGWTRGENCRRCYLCHLREIFAGVWRVLRRDGVCVIEIGDSYAGSFGNQGRKEGRGTQRPINGPILQNLDVGYPVRETNTGAVPPGLKAKDLIGIPERLRLALQADGWTVRSVAPWLRRAAMPESVTDRPSSALSWVIMLAKGRTYYWDAQAVARPHARLWDETNGGSLASDYRTKSQPDGRTRYSDGAGPYSFPNPAGRSFRNTDPYFDSLDLAIEQAAADLARLKALRASGGVLSDRDGVPMALDVNPEPSKLAHFASWPSRLIRPWILAACPERVCAACGRGWVRAVEREGGDTEAWKRPKHLQSAKSTLSGAAGSAGWQAHGSRTNDLGFRPACDHEADTLPGTVLDPFSGSGTTLLTANRLGRRGIGIDLSAEYADMARRRLERDAPMMNALQEAEREPARQGTLWDVGG